jgi:hypothetical protein
VTAVIQVVPFVDWGMVWNGSGQANPSPNSLASVGLGLQWQQGDFTARLDWGIPLVSAFLVTLPGTIEISGSCWRLSMECFYTPGS